MILEIFVKDWSNHNHKKNCKNCSQTMVYDGNWKLSRLKCCFDHVYTETCEFGRIQLGCLATPMRGSYFCKNHQGSKLRFEVDNEVINVDPATITHTKKGKNLYGLVLKKETLYKFFRYNYDNRKNLG